MEEDSLYRNLNKLRSHLNSLELLASLLITEDKTLLKKACRQTFNVLKVTRANSSSSQERKARSRREKSMIQLLISLSLLMLKSKTLPSILLKNQRPSLEKSHRKLPKRWLILRFTESFVNSELMPNIKESVKRELRNKLNKKSEYL